MLTGKVHWYIGNGWALCGRRASNLRLAGDPGDPSNVTCSTCKAVVARTDNLDSLDLRKMGNDDMAGVASVRSIKDARAILARETNNEVVITSKDGEYRVNKKGGREATAAYTEDLTDAVGTGIAMWKKGVW